MRLVLVEWQDSYGCSADWQSVDGVIGAPLTCRSVGWLLKDGDDCKVVVPHLSESDHPNLSQQGCGDMAIPTRAIVRIVDLEIPSVEKVEDLANIPDMVANASGHSGSDAKALMDSAKVVMHKVKSNGRR